MVRVAVAVERRKGFVRRADIPAELLEDLNHGRAETLTLAEWLAIDMSTLLASALPGIGWLEGLAEVAPVASQLAHEDVTRRMKGLGAALLRALRPHPRRDQLFERLASHPSDMVRGWAAYALRADRSPSFPDRLAALRRFAADPSMAVRECAWDALRPHVAADLEGSLPRLVAWAEDGDENVRRCAVEATRPLGVGCSPIKPLKADPEPGLQLLEPVRSDPSRYVQRSVANWLDDASKSRPDWVAAVCERWRQESPTAETVRIVNQALRSVRS